MFDYITNQFVVVVLDDDDDDDDDDETSKQYNIAQKNKMIV